MGDPLSFPEDGCLIISSALKDFFIFILILITFLIFFCLRNHFNNSSFMNIILFVNKIYRIYIYIYIKHFFKIFFIGV